MRLRNKISAPERYEDDDYNQGPTSRPKSTQPAFPQLMAAQVIPFNPHAPPAVFPSLELLNNADEATTTAPRSPSVQSDWADVVSFDDVDQHPHPTHVSWQKSTNLVEEYQKNDDVSFSAFGQSMFETALSSSPKLDQNETTSRDNVSWSELAVSMQLEIYKNALKANSSLETGQILGLTGEELSTIEAHHRHAIIYPVNEHDLHQRVWREYNDGLGTHLDLMNRYMNSFIHEGHLYHPFEYEIHLARTFLQQLGLDTALAGEWEQDFAVTFDLPTEISKFNASIPRAEGNGQDSGYNSGASDATRLAAHGLSKSTSKDQGTLKLSNLASESKSISSPLIDDQRKNPESNDPENLTLRPNIRGRQQKPPVSRTRGENCSQKEILLGEVTNENPSDATPSWQFSIQSPVRPPTGSATGNIAINSSTSLPRRNESRKARFNSDAWNEKMRTDAAFGLRGGSGLRKGNQSAGDFAPATEKAAQEPSQHLEMDSAKNFKLKEELNRFQRRTLILKIKTATGEAVLRKNKTGQRRKATSDPRPDALTSNIYPTTKLLLHSQAPNQLQTGLQSPIKRRFLGANVNDWTELDQGERSALGRGASNSSHESVPDLSMGANSIPHATLYGSQGVVHRSERLTRLDSNGHLDPSDQNHGHGPASPLPRTSTFSRSDSGHSSRIHIRIPNFSTASHERLNDVPRQSNSQSMQITPGPSPPPPIQQKSDNANLSAAMIKEPARKIELSGPQTPIGKSRPIMPSSPAAPPYSPLTEPAHSSRRGSDEDTVWEQEEGETEDRAEDAASAVLRNMLFQRDFVESSEVKLPLAFNNYERSKGVSIKPDVFFQRAEEQISHDSTARKTLLQAGTGMSRHAGPATQVKDKANMSKTTEVIPSSAVASGKKEKQVSNTTPMLAQTTQKKKASGPVLKPISQPKPKPKPSTTPKKVDLNQTKVSTGKKRGPYKKTMEKRAAAEAEKGRLALERTLPNSAGLAAGETSENSVSGGDVKDNEKVAKEG